MPVIFDEKNIPLVSVNRKNTRYHNGIIGTSGSYASFKKMIQFLSRRTKVHGPYAAIIEYSGKVDIDNFLKPTLDALQSAEVISNDREIECLVVFRKKRNENSLKISIETGVSHDEKLTTLRADSSLCAVPDGVYVVLGDTVSAYPLVSQKQDACA